MTGILFAAHRGYAFTNGTPIESGYVTAIKVYT
jgi:hypothetical protein